MADGGWRLGWRCSGCAPADNGWICIFARLFMCGRSYNNNLSNLSKISISRSQAVKCRREDGSNVSDSERQMPDCQMNTCQVNARQTVWKKLLIKTPDFAEVLEMNLRESEACHFAEMSMSPPDFVVLSDSKCWLDPSQMFRLPRVLPRDLNLRRTHTFHPLRGATRVSAKLQKIQVIVVLYGMSPSLWIGWNGDMNEKLCSNRQHVESILRNKKCAEGGRIASTAIPGPLQGLLKVGSYYLGQGTHSTVSSK